MTRNSGWAHQLIWVGVAVVCAAAALGAGGNLPMAPYKPPDLNSPIFGGDVTFDKAEQQKTATALAGIVRNDLDLSRPDGMRDAARLLGIALRLDPDNRAAVTINGYLTDRQRPEAQGDWKKDQAIKQIRHAAELAKAGAGKGDAKAAAYLYTVLLLLRPDDDDRFALETLKRAGATASWDWADQNSAVATPAPPVVRGGRVPPSVAPAPPAPAAGARKPMAAYKPPDLKTPIFTGDVTFDKAQRQIAATALAGIVRNGLDLSQPDGTRDAARLLGIALRLDPENPAALTINGYLTDHQRPDPQADWKKDEAIAQLCHATDIATAGQGKGDPEAAAYLYALLLMLRPDDHDRLVLETLKHAGANVTWDWADQAAAAGTLAPGVRGRTPNVADRAAIQKTLPDLSSIHGLAVIVGPDGRFHGKTLEIMAEAPKDARFVGSTIINVKGLIGPEMRISLDEALRLVKMRDANVDKVYLQISFDDKYSPKDGGSAGTAFTLLLLAALKHFELDPSAAITGDVTVDGKIRPIGAVRAKVRGAALDHMRLVGIPDGNAAELQESVLLEGPPLLWDTQVFSLSTVDDAIALMRKDRTAQLDEACRLFESLRTEMAKRPVFDLASKPEAKATLARILELAPNHLSALTLRQMAEGKAVKKLSISGSLGETVVAMGPMRDLLGPHNMMVDSRKFDAATLQEVRKEITRLREISDPSLDPVLAAITAYCYDAQSLITADKSKNTQNVEKYLAACDDQRKAIREGFLKMAHDKDIVDKLLRGE